MSLFSFSFSQIQLNTHYVIKEAETDS